MSQPKNGGAKIKTKPKKPPKKKKRIISPLKFKFKGTDGKSYELTPKQKLWCDVYLTEGMNLTQASLKSYKVTNKYLCKIPWKLLSKAETKNRARAEGTAHELGKDNFGKVVIKEYINKVLSDEGFTDKIVRTEHFKNINQDGNLSVKNTAMDMFYKLRGDYAAQKLQVGIDKRMEDFLTRQDSKLK